MLNQNVQSTNDGMGQARKKDNELEDYKLE